MKDLILTPALARAARGFLGWQQSDLAREAELSLTAIKNFEGGKKKTHPETGAKLQNAFERSGIEFPLSGGLRAREDISAVLRFSGPDFIKKWYEDIYATVRNPSEDILTSSINEALWSHPSVRAANDAFLAWQAARQISLKILTPQALKRFNLPRSFYRIVPRDLLGRITYCLYGDRIAFILWQKRQVVVLRNALVAETFRSQFLALWRNARSAAEG